MDRSDIEDALCLISWLSDDAGDDETDPVEPVREEVDEEPDEGWRNDMDEALGRAASGAVP